MSTEENKAVVGRASCGHRYHRPAAAPARADPVITTTRTGHG
jgi:hypothetical protein